MVLALLNDEQQMLQEMATSLAASVGLQNPSDLQSVDRAQGWRALADAGVLGLRVREGDVPTSSAVEVALVTEALGGALAPLPYLGSAVLSAELLALAGAPSQWQQAMADGAERYAVLFAGDLSCPATVSELGSAIAFDSEQCSYGLALSDSGTSPRLVRVPLTDGVDRQPSADLTRQIARFTDERGATEDVGSLSADQLAQWRALALAATSADTVGVMRAALNGAVAYSKERVAYGVAIGSFQAIQHMCAEALVRCEAASSCTRYAAWAVDELAPEESLLAGQTAKAYASAAGVEVAETVMQVYGGIGQTWEHIVHLYTRRALLDGQLLGDSGENLLRIADARLGEH
jgi:alkylation response protein AidB-like acyl-CoA dehydrogenase